jgi:hypothetical protein
MQNKKVTVAKPNVLQQSLCIMADSVKMNDLA